MLRLRCLGNRLLSFSVAELRISLLLLFILFTMPSRAWDWLAVTEQFPPYNYLENERPAGFATDVVNHIMSDLGEDITIDVLPWSRAMLIAESRPDTLIFSLLRTEPREHQYHWIGQLDNLSIYLWQKKLNRELNNKAELDIVYGIIRSLDDNLITILSDKYFVKKSNIISVDKVAQLIGLLLKNRVDRIVMAENAWVTAQSSLTPEQIAQLQRYELLAQRHLYLAANLNTSDKKVQVLRSAFERLENSPNMSALRRKYGLDPGVIAP